MNKKRISALYLLFLFAVSFLSVRLFVIAKGGVSVESLSGQYTRKTEIAERRGLIFDRNYESLRDGEDGTISLVIPSKIAISFEEAAIDLSAETGQKQSVIEDYLYEGAPFKVMSEKALNMKGAFSYPHYTENKEKLLSHVIGYSNSDGDGVSGILKAYNSFLRKDASGKLYARYEADAKRSSLSGGKLTVSDDKYTEKNGIVLTVDKSLQKKLEETCLAKMERGAAVVADLNTGEILAVCSMPNYDIEKVTDYLNSEKGELVNRAFSSFTPGSVFKMVVAAAALKKDISLYDYKYTCTGHIDVYGENFNCHNLSGHGELSMRDAFANSCNTYFINLALKIGIKDIIETAKSFGISDKVELDRLPVSSGLLPDTENSPPALVANTAVGQGGILITPLEAINILSAASTGKTLHFSIVRSFILGKHEFFGKAPNETENNNGNKVLDDNIVALLGEMLSACVNNGTGTAAKSDIVSVGGKTATAQSGQMKNKAEVVHRWFVGAFPMEEPKVAIAVFCDGNGEIKYAPADIFKDICEYMATEKCNPLG